MKDRIGQRLVELREALHQAYLHVRAIEGGIAELELLRKDAVGQVTAHGSQPVVPPAVPAEES